MLRGTVYPAILQESCTIIKTKYGTSLRVNTLSFEDLYAGKFCAALDRQHPRDLFDVMIFYENNNKITDKLKKAFLVYLISCNRPISELINPNRLDQSLIFEREFAGMTNSGVSYKALAENREFFINDLNNALNQQDREFLISFKLGQPSWDHLGLDHIRNMPSIKWKLHNLALMSSKKHEIALNILKQKLEV